MNKENAPSAAFAQPTARITRARAAACRAPGGGLPPKPVSVRDENRVPRANSKRSATEASISSASSTATTQRKKRTVLKDVTGAYRSCMNGVKIQQAAKHVKKNSEVAPIATFENQPSEDSTIEEIDGRTERMEIAKSQEMKMKLEKMASSEKLEENIRLDQNIGYNKSEPDSAKAQPGKPISNPLPKPQMLKKEEEKFYENKAVPGYINIDSNHSDPIMCSLYAPDIYNYLRVAELLRKPSNFMESIQRDITQSMRGILVDWLVEVSEEYKLAPDTLHLTVCLIDRFLSQNYIERHRLQLLGITCMLISSKYEEICAPRVEEFCFITDNTYTKDEVLVMERRVLNYLSFQLSAPTVQTFLRRFLQAAQASYTASSIELDFLASYIAELSLVEYEFVKIVPSLIAASAVFLARWTLNQSGCPWNSTLEHYTRYKPSDLKTTVTALQELQLNTKSCPLIAIRDKYRQPKFKSVASLESLPLYESIF